MQCFLPYFMLLAVVGLTWLTPALSSADYYKYTDNRGTVNITNKLESVPSRYRSTMKVVREEKKKAPAAELQSTAGAEQQAAPALEQQAVPEPEQKPESSFSRLCGRFVWLKPLLYVMGGVALFVVVIKVASQLGPMLSKVIYLSFFLGVFVFLYKAYAEYVVTSSARIKENAVNIMKNSSNRELPEPDEGRIPTQR